MQEFDCLHASESVPQPAFITSLPPGRPSAVANLQIVKVRLKPLNVAVCGFQVFVKSVALGDELIHDK